MKKQKNTIEEKAVGFGEVMSLLESMNDGINIISEQHGAIVGRLDGIDSRLDKIDSRLDKMDSRFDKLEAKVDKLEVKVDNLQEGVTEIKHKLSQKVDLEDFQKLEKRLIKVESFMLSFSQKH